MFQPTWLANPAFIVGVICAARRSWKKAAICGVLATGFSLVTLLLYEPDAAPASHGFTSLSLSGGWTTRLTRLMPGYWCWLVSMVLFLSGSVLKLPSMTNRLTAAGVLVAAMIVGFAGCRPSATENAAAENAAPEKATTWIRKVGGVVVRDEMSPRRPVIRVDLNRCEITDAGLEQLTGLTQLHTLNLEGTLVTDAGLERLKRLTQLRTLNLEGTQITDAGLEHLRGWPQLETLELGASKITAAGLEHLKGLTKLRKLALDNTQVTDHGLEHLKEMTQLETLGLQFTQVTDAGLECLKGLTQLQTLGLCGNKITDAGLEHLKGLSKFNMLLLRGTQVTDAGVKDFKSALLNAQILR